MSSDLENDAVMRTKRVRRCRRVLCHRSTWVVSPVSFYHSCMLLMWDHRLVSRPKVCEAMPFCAADLAHPGKNG